MALANVGERFREGETSWLKFGMNIDVEFLGRELQPLPKLDAVRS
jgi:hypothetical protein